jgi:IPT/TIG domain
MSKTPLTGLAPRLAVAALLAALLLTLAMAGPALAATPTVRTLEPHEGPAAGGTSVTILGTGFTGATAVKFGTTAASSFTVNFETVITAVSPPGSNTVDVTVTTPEGTSPTSEGDRFSYGPTVSKVEPNKGFTSGGTSVRIVGTGLGRVGKVRFGATAAASFTANSETEVTAISPAGEPGTVDVTVTAPEGTSPTNSADKFTYAPKLMPHYYKNAVLIPEGEKVPILEWGKLTLEPEGSLGDKTTCENLAGGYVENPVGGGAGIGATLRYATDNCNNLECPSGEIEVKGQKDEKEIGVLYPPQDFPWPNVLIEPEPKVVRTNSTGVVMELACTAHGLTMSAAGEGGSKGAGESERLSCLPEDLPL